MEGRNYQLEYPGIQSAYYDPSKLYKLGPGGIFVFGSNLGGRHGKGAALTALNLYGAHYGTGKGFQGRSYGIATKDANLNILPLEEIAEQVKIFKGACETCEMGDTTMWFYVTPIGTGLADYKDEDIAPLFEATPRCYFPENWRKYLGDKASIRMEYQNASRS